MSMDNDFILMLGFNEVINQLVTANCTLLWLCVEEGVWLCVGYVLVMCWSCVGYVLRKEFGYVLVMCCGRSLLCVGHVLRKEFVMCWSCVEEGVCYVLRKEFVMCWLCVEEGI